MDALDRKEPPDVIDAKAREALEGVQRKVGVFFGRRLRLTPNQVTISGVLITAVAAAFVVDGRFFVAGVLLVAGGLTDFIDGAVAKATDSASTFGAFVDSTSDRVSDAIVLSAIIWFYIAEGDPMYAAVTLAALVGAQMTSYIRAKAESLGYDCRVGVLERAERMIGIMAGLLFGILQPVLWILAVGAAFTVVQRLVHVSRQGRSSSTTHAR